MRFRITLALTFWFAILGGIFWTPWCVVPFVLLITMFILANFAKGWFGRLIRKIMWPLFMRNHFKHIFKRAHPLLAYPLMVYLEFSAPKDYIEKGHNKFIDHVSNSVLKGPMVGKNMKTEWEDDTEYFDRELARARPDLVMQNYVGLDAQLENSANYDKEGNFIHPLK